MIDLLLRKCCDTCTHFWVDAPTRYSQCKKIGEQIDGEDIAFIIKIGCASHSSQEPTKYKPLIDAMQEFVDRCDRGEIRSKYTYAKFKEVLKGVGEE